VSLNALLVNIGGSLVLALVDLARDCISCTRDAVAEGVLAGDIALGLLLAGLFLSLGSVALEGVRYVVDGVTDRVGDGGDNALVRSVNVGCRHCL